MKVTREVRIGSFVELLDESDIAVVSCEVARELEKCLLKVQTSSLIVRLDMAPWEGEGTPPIYEVETAPGGIMFWGLFSSFPREAISSLADVGVCLDPNWEKAYRLLGSLTGWEIFFSWEEVSPGNRVYFSGGPSEVPRKLLGERKLLLVTDPFSPKTEVLKITGGERIAPGGILALKDLNRKFPDGFVLKPVWGYGSKDVYIYPRGRYGRMRGRGGTGRKKICELLSTPKKEEWLVQPFFPPKMVETGIAQRAFLIWRIYAIRRNREEPFRLLGGLWNLRPHLKVHGASNTITGPVVIE